MVGPDCPATCFGETCSFWAGECSMLESEYGCDCKNCPGCAGVANDGGDDDGGGGSSDDADDADDGPIAVHSASLRYELFGVDTRWLLVGVSALIVLATALICCGCRRHWLRTQLVVSATSLQRPSRKREGRQLKRRNDGAAGEPTFTIVSSGDEDDIDDDFDDDDDDDASECDADSDKKKSDGTDDETEAFDTAGDGDGNRGGDGSGGRAVVARRPPASPNPIPGPGCVYDERRSYIVHCLPSALCLP
jgi:hypothetical protein